MAEWFIVYEGQIKGHIGSHRGGRVRVHADTAQQASRLALEYCDRVEGLEGVTIDRTARIDDVPLARPEYYPAADPRTKIRVPKYTREQFTATQFDSDATKARIANMVTRFMLAGMPAEGLTAELYKHMNLHLWGHIAHYNRHGFANTWFSEARRRIDFLSRAISWRAHGDATHTWCDVEAVLSPWIKENWSALVRLAAGETDQIDIIR